MIKIEEEKMVKNNEKLFEYGYHLKYIILFIILSYEIITF